MPNPDETAYNDDDGRQHSETRDDSSPTSTAGAAAGAATGRENDLEPPGDRPAPGPASLAYTLEDEPLEAGRPVDYRYLYELVRTRFAREEERGKTLDAKFAVLLTGVVASIGFSFRTTITPVAAGVNLLYLAPLALIAWGYTTKIGEDAPSIESLETEFPYYPVSTLREAIKAMRLANVTNRKVNNSKADRFDWAFVATLVVTVAILFVQFLSADGLIKQSERAKNESSAAPPRWRISSYDEPAATRHAIRLSCSLAVPPG